MPEDTPLHAPQAGTARGCAVVKLGGGLVTRLDAGVPVLDGPLVENLARELAATGMPLVLVHGTGAFGKPPARAHGYLDGRLGPGRAGVVAEVTQILAGLEAELTRRLVRGGVRPFRLPAAALFRSTGGRVRLERTEVVEAILARGMTAVLGGSFVLDDAGGFSVCSSDDMAALLAAALQARCLVFATRARGVYRDPGAGEEIFGELRAVPAALPDTIATDPADVSGGMRGKVAKGLAAAHQGVATFVVDGRVPGNLAGTLAGQPIAGTRLVADQAGA